MSTKPTFQHLLPATILSIVMTAQFACSPPQPGQIPPPSEPAAAVSGEIPLSEFGQLQIFSTGLMTDGRNLKVRGLIRNPYPEPIEGIRVILRMLASPEDGAREVDRFQREFDERLASGEQTALRFDVQTMYAGMGGMNRFELAAFAVARGGQALPPPPGWKE